MRETKPIVLSHLSEPKVEVLDGSDVGTLLVGLLQLERFLCRLLSEELPLVSDRCKSSLHTITFILHDVIFRSHLDKNQDASSMFT